jgi:hypothetical protein
MDEEGTADISPAARFGITEAEITEKLFNGLVELYKIERGSKSGRANKFKDEVSTEEHPQTFCEIM